MKALRENKLVELVGIVVVALVLAFGIQWLLVKPYRIPSGSMEPTLDIGQRVLVDRLTPRFRDYERGDVVVFHPPVGADDAAEDVCGDPAQPEGAPCDKALPQQSGTTFIKRIIALPGDRLKVVDGHAIVNGKRQSDSYIAACGGGDGCDLPKEITIPKGAIFMMGDNRGESFDSRFWGPVPEGWVIGRAFATYWPPNRIGGL
ncbi:MAG: signal peptidase I [Solirubrobacterales bacterium]|nr:signal peptidase I [Solirubrobacterales bacterium]